MTATCLFIESLTLTTLFYITQSSSMAPYHCPAGSLVFMGLRLLKELGKQVCICFLVILKGIISLRIS